MKAAIALLVSGLAAQQVSATWNRGAGFYKSPQYNNNECSDKQKGGFNWSDLKDGDKDFEYGDFDFKKGWSCSNSFGKRDHITKRSFNPKCIKNKVEKEKPAKFGCDKRKDGFSIVDVDISVEYDVDLEFHYKMPDGSTCKQVSPCKKEGTTVRNTQCGGAREVEVYIGKHWEYKEEKKKSCEIGFHHINFDCEPEKPYNPPGPPEQPPKTTEKCKGKDCPEKPPKTEGCKDGYCPEQPPKTTDKPEEPPKTSDKPEEPPKTTEGCKDGYCPEQPPKTSEKCKGKDCPEEPPKTSNPPEQPPQTSGPEPPSTTGYPANPPEQPPQSSEGCKGPECPQPPQTTTPPTPPEQPQNPPQPPTTTGSCKGGYGGYGACPSGQPPYPPPYNNGTCNGDKCEPTPPPKCEGDKCEPTPPPKCEGDKCEPTPPPKCEGDKCEPTPPPKCEGDKCEPTPPPKCEGDKCEPTPPPKCEGDKCEPTPPPNCEGDKCKPENPQNPPETPEAPQPPTGGASPPECLPKCMNTWIQINTKCKDNTDAQCYCKNPDFTKSVIECVTAWSEDDKTSETLQYLIGICAEHVPENPGIVTDCPPYIPLNPPTPTPEPGQPPVTKDIPCTTITYGSTSITVPQIHFYTPTAPAGGPEPTEPVVLVPGTTPPPAPANPTGPVEPPYPVPSTMGTVPILPTGTGYVNGTAPPEFTGAASPINVEFKHALLGAALAFFAL